MRTRSLYAQLASGVPARPRIGVGWVAAIVLACLAASILTFSPAVGSNGTTIWPSSTVPGLAVDPDTHSVELGTRFHSHVAGSVTAVRFYRTTANPGPHEGSLWTGDGHLLAHTQFDDSAATGWLVAVLDTPVRLSPGVDYVVSYHSPAGRYSATVGAFADGRTVTNGPLTATAGVYSYSDGFPRREWMSASYLADVVFQAAPSTDPTPRSTSTFTKPPTAPPSPSQTATSTSMPTSGGPTTTSSPTTLESLPRIPWDGGPAYYQRFHSAASNGWTDPSFFPIGVWWSTFSSDEEVRWDKAHGINTYIVTNPDTPNSAAILERNGMSYIGGPVRDMTRSSKAWVGDFLDDEVDGRYSVTDGLAYLRSIAAGLPDHNKIRYANYTGMVISWLSAEAAKSYVNDFTDAVSLDNYIYTSPFCDWAEYQGDLWLVPMPRATCRTSSSYGKTVDALRQRDAADGSLQPIWNFVEAVYGPGDPSYAARLSPGQLKGAAMNSIIHEARGLVWFPQSFSGECGSGNAIRSAEVNPAYACAAHVATVGDVNNLVSSLAPVLNTQSYRWVFGPGLETMLKMRDGYAYIFAMSDGTTGDRIFTLPPGVAGDVEVIGEARTVGAKTGHFTDNFPAEYVYHVYKVKLG